MSLLPSFTVKNTNTNSPDEGREDGKTTAEHGGSIFESHIVGDLEAELRVAHNDAGVTTVRNLSVGVLAVVLLSA